MKRQEAIAEIESAKEPWDFLVIGGGATGLGVGVDAAARGYRSLLVEQADFAKGTSSRSTKLVHGGVRYLKQGGAGGAAGARAAVRKRSAPGSPSVVYRADLQLVGGALLRHWNEDLRPAGGQAGAQSL